MGDAYGAAIIESLSKKELETLAVDPVHDENRKNSTGDVSAY